MFLYVFFDSILLTAAAVAQLSQSGWSSLSEQWKACIADIVLGNLPEQFILQVSISICSILAQGRTLCFEYKQNMNQHILTDNSKLKTEQTSNPLTELQKLNYKKRIFVIKMNSRSLYNFLYHQREMHWRHFKTTSLLQQQLCC